MGDELKKYLLTLLGGISIPGLVVVYMLLHPEKVEKWSALVWRFLSGWESLFRFAHKRYVKHDMQGRVNEFARTLSKDAPFLTSKRVRVEWVGPNETRKSVLQDGRVILRLRRDDPQDLNFVHGAYLFVSQSLLFQVKRYLSKSQRKSVDLYVTTSLIEQQKPAVKGHFLDRYLHPQLADTDSKIARFYDAYAKIDEGGFFYPVFLQELDFLGQKVFGARKDDQIIIEVNSLIDFLEPVATRQIGDEGELVFRQQYCRFAIVIVGKSYNLLPSGEPFVKYIRRVLVPARIETVYLVGREENKRIIKNICRALRDVYDECRTRTSKVVLRYGERRVPRRQFLVVLRMKGTRLFQPSD
jgi:hypothetical protein